MQADTAYRVFTALRAVHTSAEKHGFVSIPADATVRIVTNPNGDQFVQVLWDNKHLLVFAQDLRERAMLSDSIPSQETGVNNPRSFLVTSSERS